jgi:hypothetical protein
MSGQATADIRSFWANPGTLRAVVDQSFAESIFDVLATDRRDQQRRHASVGRRNVLTPAKVTALGRAYVLTVPSWGDQQSAI